MPPAYQAVGTAAGDGGGGALTPAWPSHVADDIGILVVVARAFSDPGAATLTTANGFTAVTGGSDLTVDGGGVWNTRVTLFWCRATSGSMSAPDVAGSTNRAAVIITFRGCTTSGDPTEGTPGLGANASSNTSVTAPGPTTTGADRAILVAIGHEGTSTIASYSNAALASITERMDTEDAGNNSHITLVTATKATAGAVGNTTATLSGNQVWSSVVIALKGADAVRGNLLLLGVG